MTMKKADINTYYVILIFLFGVSFGYHVLPKIFNRSEREVLESGAVYGILKYKDHLQKEATFEIVSDTILIIRTNNDSLFIYK
jgi:hypothetical protein